jgi:hypothetical protein
LLKEHVGIDEEIAVSRGGGLPKGGRSEKWLGIDLTYTPSARFLVDVHFVRCSSLLWYVIWKFTVLNLVYFSGESHRCAEKSNKKPHLAAKEVRLTINLRRSKLIYVTKRPANSGMLKVDDQEFERAREFICLGSTPTDDNNITVKIKQNYDG